jgi:NodT family efflux transporter outer membrane factor (OMF) lipoprotein
LNEEKGVNIKMRKLPEQLVGAALVILVSVLFNSIGYAAESTADAKYEGLTKESWTDLALKYPEPYFEQDEKAALSPEILANWWSVMQDDTLTRLITLSLQQNKDLLSARARVNEARAALGISKATLLPWLDANGSWTRTDTSENSPYTGLRGFHTDYKLGMDASWEIDVFGRQRENVRAASASLQAEHASLYANWVTLSSEVAMNYISLRALQERLDIVKEQVKSQEKSIELLQTRRDAGLISDLPLAQAIYTLQQTQAEIPELKTSISETMNRLAILTGSLPGSLQATLQKNSGLPDINPQLYAAIPADSLRQRPDIHAAERKLAAQLAKTKAAKGDLKPKFSLFGSLGWESENSGSLISIGSKGFSIGPQISLPIFHAGAIHRNIDVQTEKEKEYFADYENTVLQAVAEVRNSLTGLSQERERKEALQKGTKSAKDALELAQNSYENGLTDYHDVLDAQRNLLKLQNDYVVSKGQELTDLVQLFKAMGGGWSPLENDEINNSNIKNAEKVRKQ